MASAPFTFVVVGGGIAGVTCAETLAYLNPERKICLLTKSRLVKTVTNLVPVSKMLFNFNVEEKDANTLSEKYPNISVIYDTLSELKTSVKTMVTEQGREIQYEFVCLCVGAQPKLIEAKSQYVLGIRDTDSVQVFQERLKNAKKILIVGNGGIATELVHELKNIEIVWAIKDDHITSTFLDPGAAEFFQKTFQNNIDDTAAGKKDETVIKRVRYSETVTSQRSGAALGPDWHAHYNITGSTNEKKLLIEYNCEINNIIYNSIDSNWPITVILTNNKEILCDFVVSATGVTPCRNIKTDNVLKLSDKDGGILVNEQMLTSIPGIYAAGDVCTANWELAKHWFQMRLWSQARQMGSYAAKSMTCELNNEPVVMDFCFELFAHSTRLFNYKVALLGLYNGQKLSDQYELLMRVTPNVEYIKLVLVNGRVQGAILIGDTDLEETVENLILNQLDVTPYGEDLLNPNIDIEDYFD